MESKPHARSVFERPAATGGQVCARQTAKPATPGKHLADQAK